MSARRTTGRAEKTPLDPIALEIFRGLFVALCEEMGLVLMKSASSTNIKERRDYSCAIFDDEGRTIAQGDHMPVHLGSMPASVQAVLEDRALGPGDVALLNDPFHGGTHLPDITMVAPVFLSGASGPLFYVACRAHHADIGGMQAGSMPLASEIFQEGLILPPVLLVEGGKLNHDLMTIILANVRTPRERREDLDAQRAALAAGENRLRELVGRYGPGMLAHAGASLRAYSAHALRSALRGLESGVYRHEDRLDDDGFGALAIPLRVTITVRRSRAIVDLRGCADQVRGGVNASRPITVSAILYAFRCLIHDDVPSNQGLLEPLTILTRPGSIVDALSPAAVAAGNVETSQRIVDLLFGALARAHPGRIPAASQGTMNNLAMGGDWGDGRGLFAYYETVAGGMGARPSKAGVSGVHTHMTNSLNTPIEALERAIPVRAASYTLRRGSGGAGRHRGGDGVVRSLEALVPMDFSILSERRLLAPYGLAGGKSGKPGRNWLVRSRRGMGKSRSRAGAATKREWPIGKDPKARREPLPGKMQGRLETGDILIIETPGGGGWGPTPRHYTRPKRAR